jgi:undecaprenyl diphosphate synthase
LTRGNDGLTLVVAFNYGARQEIARAARRLAIEVAEGRLSADEVTPERLGSHLARSRHSRSRRDHPHQRRAAAVQLPALAGGL